MINKKVIILQPSYPHYRSEFIYALRNEIKELMLFSYLKTSQTIDSGYKVDIESEHILRISYGRFLWYNPISILKREIDFLVLPLNISHLTTWLLLVTKFFHGKRVILWGQGISVKRYQKEVNKPNWAMKSLIKMSDGVWLYMNEEFKRWKSIFPNKPIVALGNSLTDVEKMISYQSELSVSELKVKYGIKQSVVFIFCARFENVLRRVDLLEKIIQSLDSTKYGFIIIGEGKNKPNFHKYKNVYDYGAVYDNSIKQDLFSLADLYLQPAYCGLSIVEALAYGRPVCTFKRCETIKQGVEFSYVKDGINGMLFTDIDDCLSRLNTISPIDIRQMSEQAKSSVSGNTPKRMVERALSIL